MADRFTDVTQTGFFSRLLSSFVGLLVGPILVIGAIILLSWNEGRAVHAIVGLGEAAGSVVEAAPDSVSPANDGKLVHVIGTATAAAPIKDDTLGTSFSGQTAVFRTAEMYQWREHEESSTENQLGGGQKTVTTYTYSEEWSDHAIDSSLFKHPDGHQNPQMTITSQRFVAGDAKLGAYTLDDATVALLQPANALTPDVPAGWSSSGGALYNGDTATPKIGETRVSYKSIPAGTTLSVMAQQSAGGFASFVTPNGYQIHMASIGNQPASVMIAEEKKSESMLTWILRGAGALMIFIGICAFLGPIATFGAVIPFLGAIMRGAIAGIAFVITVPLTLVVIAVAWFAFRPVMSGGILLVAALSLYGLGRWHRSRHPQAVAKGA